jgi:hypothetical protein
MHRSTNLYSSVALLHMLRRLRKSTKVAHALQLHAAGVGCWVDLAFTSHNACRGLSGAVCVQKLGRKVT